VIPLVLHRPISSPDDLITDAEFETMIDVVNDVFCDIDIMVVWSDVVNDAYDPEISTGPLDNEMRELVVHTQENWDDMRVHVYATDEIRNPVTMTTYGGFYLHVDDQCTGALAIRRDVDPKILAHELGHMLGLSHVDDPTNMMYPSALSAAQAFTPEQQETMRVNAEWMDEHCWCEV
jgi:hypothetical protein